jgi:hypothetical protein
MIHVFLLAVAITLGVIVTLVFWRFILIAAVVVGAIFVAYTVYILIDASIRNHGAVAQAYTPSKGDLDKFDEFIREGGDAHALPLQFLEDIDRVRHNTNATSLVKSQTSPTPSPSPSPDYVTKDMKYMDKFLEGK